MRSGEQSKTIRHKELPTIPQFPYAVCTQSLLQTLLNILEMKQTSKWKDLVFWIVDMLSEHWWKASSLAHQTLVPFVLDQGTRAGRLSHQRKLGRVLSTVCVLRIQPSIITYLLNPLTACNAQHTQSCNEHVEGYIKRNVTVQYRRKC